MAKITEQDLRKIERDAIHLLMVANLRSRDFSDLQSFRFEADGKPELLIGYGEQKLKITVTAELIEDASNG